MSDDGNEPEVDDYMSNEFLEKLEDTRPGLLSKKSSTARRYEVEKKHAAKCEQNRQLPIAKLEENRRNEALSTSTLAASNRGFNMMLKMGYKEGNILGKRSDEPEHRKKLYLEPISVELKSNREGLGQAEEKKQKLDAIQLTREQIKQRQQHAQQLYIDSKRSNFQLRKITFSLHKCQRVCFHLDSTQGNLKLPAVAWYWPKNVLKSMRVDKTEPTEPHISESESASQVETTEEECAETAVKHNQDRKIDIIESMVAVDKSNLNMNQVYQQRLDKFIAEPQGMDSAPTSQAKRQHEASSSSENESETEHEHDIRQRKLKHEMDKNENEHEALSDIEAAAADDDDDDDLDDNEETISRKINEICSYLRSDYNYCVWCATSYDNEQDLEQNCPGLTEKDHEYDE